VYAAETVVAEVRFNDGPEKYQGQPYLWLGNGGIGVTIPVAPRRDHRIGLLWGSKNDQRTATMTVNGKDVALAHGGYDGFRWLQIPMPEGIAGDRYEIEVQPASGGRPAFLAGIQLTAKEEAAVSAAPITYKTIAIKLGEAFPEMRNIWDRQPPDRTEDPQEKLFRQAEKNGRLANEAFFRCRRFIDGWLAHADPETGLIPRNLGDSRDYWNGRDSGADNYPFMVLTASMTDRPLLEGRLLDMLRTETRLTCRVDRLPDDYSFSKKGWRREKVDMDALIFEGAEYVKDGLLYTAEWLGPSPWSERMIGIMDDIWKNAAVNTPFGKIPTTNFEVHGDLMQASSRLYWFTRDRKYLDWAIRLGDYYLLGGGHHPTRDMTELRLLDHGCEAVNGLTELYVAVSHAEPEKKKAYEQPLHEVFDRILEVARNENGLLYASINPKTGEHSEKICDTWGYDYEGVYTMYLVDKTDAYREAVRKVLTGLPHLIGHWRDMDNLADSIEGAINLYNREPIAEATEYIESEIRAMWSIQKPDGLIESWHGDGNFARTSLMYALWKTQGLHIEPWRSDVRIGAVRDGERLLISLMADQPWRGKLIFDRPRHKVNMHLPLDYPRINQFPEWFTVQEGKRYAVRPVAGGPETEYTAEQLAAGIEIALQPGVQSRQQVTQKK
jgi:hypothetical protein